MITEAEYDRVQALLGRNGNPRPQSQLEFAFTGLIRCGDCHRMVTAEEKHQVMCGQCRFKFAYRKRKVCPRCKTTIEKMVNPLFLHYTYYHCSKSKRPLCPQKCVSGQELEKQIGNYIARIHISEIFKDWAIKYLHELHAQESATQKAIIETQQKAYQECVQGIDNLVELRYPERCGCRAWNKSSCWKYLQSSGPRNPSFPSEICGPQISQNRRSQWFT